MECIEHKILDRLDWESREKEKRRRHILMEDVEVEMKENRRYD